MDKYSPKKEGKRKKQLYGIAMVLVSLLVAGGVAMYIIIVPPDKTLNDKLCPAEEGPSSIRVVIVDATDPYNPIQWQNIENRLSNIKEEIPRHGLLAIFSVTQSVQKTLQPEIELCNPGSGEKLNIWTANPELARRRWERSFVSPIDSIISNINTEGPRSRSPIMETIQAAKAHVGAYDTEDQNLVIVSDMMQHTEGYSHYGAGPPDYDDFESAALDEKLSVDLSGWDVEILYARRGQAESPVQGRRHVDFWDRYFLENGATLQRVKSIDG